MTIMTSSNNILDNFYRDGEKYLELELECILKNGEHDYESINRQQISKNIIEIECVCLDCGHLNYVYNYLEDSDYDF